MKKLLLLIVVCAMGIVAPQKMLADIVYPAGGNTDEHLSISTSDGGKTITISSNQASALWAILKHGSEANKTAIVNALTAATGEGSKIIFSGKFSGDDLKSLNENGCCLQETVDMGETTFERHVDLENSINSYKIKVDAAEGDSEYDINAKLNAKAAEKGITLQNGDLGVYGNKFFRFDGATWQLVQDHPVFESKERMAELVDGYGSVAMAKDENGNPTIYTYSNNPATGQNEWYALSQSGYDEMTFTYWGSNVKTAITSKNVGADDAWPSNLTQNCSSLEYLTLNSGKVTTLGGVKPTTKVTIGNKVVELGTDLFQDGTFTELEFEQGGTDPLIIRRACFQRCRNFPTVTIPARTTLIEREAFDTNDALTTITFETPTTQNDPMLIKSGAFMNISSVTDVNVNINPTQKLMICEYNAFDYDILVAQTRVDGNSAVLHFPEEYFGFYAGDWKRGMTFTQNNLNQIKDGITDNRTVGNDTYIGAPTQDINKLPGGLEQIDHNNDGLYHPEDDGKMYAPGNGWQQFARTDTGIDVIIPKGKYFRTYSTEEAQAKPEWMELYRITNFSDGFNENSDASSRTQADAATKSATAKKITNTETGNYDLIPAKTGVIRVDNVTEDALYYFMDWSLTMLTYNNSWEFPYNEDLTNTGKVNFMKPTNDSPKEIGPVVKEGGVITHRIFGLLASGEFSRAKHMTMKENRAYLQLPADMFHWKDETTTASQGATTGATASQYSKISMVFDMELEDVFGEGVATEIKKAIENEEYKNDTFYTLQGVRVAKPTTKGVYIRNGKKIYVK